MNGTRTPAVPGPREAALADAEDRHVLGLCFVVAVLVHAGLLFLPVPWTDAAAAPEPPPRVVHRIVSVLPPPPDRAPEPEPPEAPPVPEDARFPVLGAIVPPEAVFVPRPDYPEAARQVGRGGTVILLATIDQEGRVTDLEVLRAEPLGLTEAALAAVRRWRFRPATLEDRPVAVYYHLTVRFETR